MKNLFIEYPKCSTCQKAKKHLERMGVDFIDRPIKEGVTKEELQIWIPLSNKPIQKFFNTSGQLYRNGNYKERLPQMSDNEKMEALASDGMLVKRPLLVGDNFVLVGYNEKEYDEIGEKYGKKQ